MVEPRSTARVVELLGPSTGGIRRHVEHLAEGLRRRGWDVVVAGPVGMVPGSTTVAVPDGLSPVGLVRARCQLADVVAGADLVHAHGLKPGWIAASLRHRPLLVVSVHNIVLDEVAGRAATVLRALEARLPARADRVIAVSAEVARHFTGRPGADRVRVVPPTGPRPAPDRPAAVVRSELGIEPEAKLLVTAARLHPQKDLPNLFEAVERVRSRIPEVRAVVFGDGALRDALERDLVSRGLGDVVRLAGPRPSVAAELAAADAVVVPSRWESGPLVVFEALALGRPVVTTAVGAAPEVVIDGVTGRLVPVGDSAALADAIEDVLGDPARAAAMGAAGRDLVSERLGDRLVDAVADVYRELLL